MEEQSLHAEGQEAAKSSLSPAKQDLSNKSVSAGFAAFDPARHIGTRSLGKDERLSRELLLDKLFSEGRSVSQNGFTLVYLKAELPTFFPAQTAFSVPKRYFNNATDRNRIKRLLREAYRHHKSELYLKLSEAKQQYAMMLIFKGKEVPGYDVVKKNVAEIMGKLISKLK